MDRRDLALDEYTRGDDRKKQSGLLILLHRSGSGAGRFVRLKRVFRLHESP